MNIIVVCPPLDKVRIPRRTAARPHFVVINKGTRQFYLNSDKRLCTIRITFSLIWSNVPQYIKMYVARVSVKTERDISKMSRNKLFDFRARFGAIYSVSKTKKYFSKNSTIGNRLLFWELENTGITSPEHSNWWLLLPQSNFFLVFKNNFTAKFWRTFY